MRGLVRTDLRRLEIQDALADRPRLRAQSRPQPRPSANQGQPTPEVVAALERRFASERATDGRYYLRATIDGEPARAAGMNLHPPQWRHHQREFRKTKFRGRRIYRTLVAARLEDGRWEGIPGLPVWGGPRSTPILAQLGFVKAGWRRFLSGLPGECP